MSGNYLGRGLQGANSLAISGRSGRLLQRPNLFLALPRAIFRPSSALKFQAGHALTSNRKAVFQGEAAPSAKQGNVVNPPRLSRCRFVPGSGGQALLLNFVFNCFLTYISPSQVSAECGSNFVLPVGQCVIRRVFVALCQIVDKLALPLRELVLLVQCVDHKFC